MSLQLKQWARIDLYNIQFPEDGITVYRLADLVGSEIKPENWMIEDVEGREILKLKLSDTVFAVSMSKSAIRDFKSLNDIFGTSFVDFIVFAAQTEEGAEYLTLRPGAETKASL